MPTLRLEIITNSLSRPQTVDGNNIVERPGENSLFAIRRVEGKREETLNEKSE